jgi:hypothetical protein
MAKRKDRQYNDKKKGQTIQWPKERTDNTLAKRKDRQYNGQKKGQTMIYKTLSWRTVISDSELAKYKSNSAC